MEYFEFSNGDHIQLSKSFNSKEFECPGLPKDHKNKISKDLIANLQTLRDKLDQPLTITSGYRSPEQNSKVGGVAGSQHLLGNAADFTCSDLDKAYSICETLFHGIGDGRHKGKFIHVDVRPSQNGHRAKWVY